MEVLCYSDSKEVGFTSIIRHKHYFAERERHTYAESGIGAGLGYSLGRKLQQDHIDEGKEDPK